MPANRLDVNGIGEIARGLQLEFLAGGGEAVDHREQAGVNEPLFAFVLGAEAVELLLADEELGAGKIILHEPGEVDGSPREFGQRFGFFFVIVEVVVEHVPRHRIVQKAQVVRVHVIPGRRVLVPLAKNGEHAVQGAEAAGLVGDGVKLAPVRRPIFARLALQESEGFLFFGKDAGEEMSGVEPIFESGIGRSEIIAGSRFISGVQVVFEDQHFKDPL